MANAKTNLTQTNIAFKKLVGKATTAVTKTDTAESIGSLVQLDTSVIFNQRPTALGAHLDMYANNGIIERVEIDFTPVAGTIYNANSADSDAESTANETHAYVASLKDNYQTFSTVDAFENGFTATGSDDFQFVPSSYGFRYVPELLDASGTTITTGDDIDWYFDAFSGILFVQDPDPSVVPTSGSAYLYIGTFASESGIIPVDTLQSVTTAGHQTSQSIQISGAAGAETLLVSGGLVDFSDSTNVSMSFATASQLQVLGNADVNSNLNVDGTLAVGGNVTLGTTVSDTVTIAGDLFVNGATTNVNVANLNIEDKFILLNSHSGDNAVPGDGGIIIQTSGSTNGNSFGTALFWDQSRDRWSLTHSSSNAEGTGNEANPDVVLTTTQITTGVPSATPPLFGDEDGVDYAKGQFYVDNGDAHGLYVYI